MACNTQYTGKHKEKENWVVQYILYTLKLFPLSHQCKSKELLLNTRQGQGQEQGQNIMTLTIIVCL